MGLPRLQLPPGLLLPPALPSSPRPRARCRGLSGPETSRATRGGRGAALRAEGAPLPPACPLECGSPRANPAARASPGGLRTAPLTRAGHTPDAESSYLLPARRGAGNVRRLRGRAAPRPPLPTPPACCCGAEAAAPRWTRLTWEVGATAGDPERGGDLWRAGDLPFCPPPLFLRSKDIWPLLPASLSSKSRV